MAERSAFTALRPLHGAPMPDETRFGLDWRGWLEEQFARHAALVRTVVWDRLGREIDPHQVEELAAETWVRVVRTVQAPGFEFERNFAPWVCAIATNVCKEYFRREQRAATLTGLLEPDDLQNAEEFKRAQALLELHRALAECLDGLTEGEKKVYQLRYEQGLSGRATADALGVPESTFREKLLVGLLAKLARCLADKGFDELLPDSAAHRRPVGQRIDERRLP